MPAPVPTFALRAAKGAEQISVQPAGRFPPLVAIAISDQGRPARMASSDLNAVELRSLAAALVRAAEALEGTA